MQDTGYWILGYWILDARNQEQKVPDARRVREVFHHEGQEGHEGGAKAGFQGFSRLFRVFQGIFLTEDGGQRTEDRGQRTDARFETWIPSTLEFFTTKGTKGLEQHSRNQKKELQKHIKRASFHLSDRRNLKRKDALMQLWEVYKEKVLGTIKGLDRIRFRGTLRWLSSERGVNTFCSRAGILLKDFGKWAEEKTSQLRSLCEQQAKSLGIPTLYLKSLNVNKEKLAREIAKDTGVGTDGSICMLSVVEPCMAPSVSGNRQTKQLELTYRRRNCIHFYHYFDHPELGFGHVRIQSWIPFGVTLCLNGRHWLEKQLLREGIGFVKQGNCFPWLEDIDRAQKLMDDQLKTNWASMLDRLVLKTCPQFPELLSPLEFDYYWSADETEWATDIMFSDDRTIRQIYPELLRYAMIVSDSPSVMRYLSPGKQKEGEKRTARLPEELVSDCRRRHEGMRVKHWIRNNSIKLYNKTDTLLRIETTINSTRDFKVFRSPNDDPRRVPSWQRLRKGVSDLHRRCQISDSANNRYAEAISTAQVRDKLKDVLGPACRRMKKDGRFYRALNPWSPQDFQLLSFFGKGELAINGFRNKDLRKFLYGEVAQGDRVGLRRLSGRVSRLIGLMRAHGLVRKIPNVNRYMPTQKGRKISTALLCASAVEIKELMEKAA